jgi:hypothetical protein
MADKNQTPKPDPALHRLDRLVGTWAIKGHAVDSDEDNITGTTTYKWLYGEGGESFYLEQDMEMDYAGKLIKSHELIGYDPQTKAFASYVNSNLAPDPWPYKWDVRGDDITISIKKPPMDATFNGKFAPDGNSFSGGWRPNRGADEKINTPYDATLTRVK